MAVRPYGLAAAPAADPPRLVAAVEDGPIRSSDAVTGRPLAGDLGHGSTVAVVPLPDGGTAIASSPEDGVIEIARLPEQG